MALHIFPVHFCHKGTCGATVKLIEILVMHFKKPLIITIILLVFAVIVDSASAQTDDFKDFAEIDLEAMLDIEIVSASKYRQKLSESPNAVTVITSEDITRSGAVDIPDLFRMVPGMDVINVYGNTYAVSARGFNERLGGRMLVMIDGRSIYTNFFGGVFWENEEVFLEDIKQIEVIRGPGATMWGANTVNGVINIITKDPEESREYLVAVRTGTKHYREGVFRFSDRLTDRFSVSLTGGYREDDGTRGQNDFRRVPKATGRATYRITDNSVVNIFCGVNESEAGLVFTRFTPEADVHMRSQYQMVRWEHTLVSDSTFHLQFYHSYWEFHSDDTVLDIEERKFDLELQHSFTLNGTNRIVWGGNLRSVEVASNYVKGRTEHDDIIGLFVQDEIRLYENLVLVAGVKYENNSFTGRDFSPRGSLLYSFTDNQQVRLSVARAYRTPSFAESTISLVQKMPPPFSGVPLLAASGNQGIDVEKMTAFELGYRTILYGKIGLNVELYYNELDRLVKDYIEQPMWPYVISWDNRYNAIAKGMEVAVDVPLTPWWLLRANYTYQSVEYKRIDQDYIGAPRHKFNIESRFTFTNGFSMDVRLHYVDEAKWNSLTGRVKTDDYLRLDIRIAQRLFNDRLELSLVGQNLTDKRHPETFDVVGEYQVDRLIYGQVTFRFR